MYLLQKLILTYDRNRDQIGKENYRLIGKDKKGEDFHKAIVPLLPFGHSTQHAHVTVTLDARGNLIKACVNNPGETNTIIPVTEKSSARTSSLNPHPLFDKLQYTAGDYSEFTGKKNGFPAYIALLKSWLDFDPENPFLRAVYEYVRKGTLIGDLTYTESDRKKIFYADPEIGQLILKWQDKNTLPPIFSLIKTGTPADAFIRWEVIMPGENEHRLWKMESLQYSWEKYLRSKEENRGLCYVTGKEQVLAELHPAKIRNAGDGAKIISSNDSNGYTYRGQLLEPEQVCGIGMEASQTGHSALRWLISKQGIQWGSFCIVAWSPGHVNVPPPCLDRSEEQKALADHEDGKVSSKGTGESQGTLFARLCRGSGFSEEKCRALDAASDSIEVLSLDSATPGRLAVTYHQQFKASLYRKNVLFWHTHCAWPQWGQNGELPFASSPLPENIAKVAYGANVEDKVKAQTVRRVLPCIVGNSPLPRDLVNSCVNRAGHRAGTDFWLWEQALRTACALYKYNHLEEAYSYKLQPERTERSYLFGRLIAFAEFVEKETWNHKQENHCETNAERYFRAFFQRPCTTWKELEKALVPYWSKLILQKEGTLEDKKTTYTRYLKNETDLIISRFHPGDFLENTPLEGSYLIGYYAQRREFYLSKEKREENKSTQEENSLLALKPLFSRDYAFGRLFAVAEYTEHQALTARSSQERLYSTEKYFTVFLQSPARIWMQIELSLTPYLEIILKWGNVLVYRRIKNLLDEIMQYLTEEDFQNKTPLTPEALLGFHSQRAVLFRPYEIHFVEDKPLMPSQQLSSHCDYSLGRLIRLAEAYEQKSRAIKAAKLKRLQQRKKTKDAEEPSLLPSDLRLTQAERTLSYFSHKPMKAWQELKCTLNPYLEKPFYQKTHFLEAEASIMKLIPSHDLSQKPLSPIFLLGYHHQNTIH